MSEVKYVADKGTPPVDEAVRLMQVLAATPEDGVYSYADYRHAAVLRLYELAGITQVELSPEGEQT